MATPGLDVIMSWTPNYDHPHEPLDAVIYGVNIPLMVLMTIFVAGRFLSRTFLVRNALGVDDWMMLVAYVGTSAGFGRTFELTLAKDTGNGSVGVSASRAQVWYWPPLV